MTVISAAAIYLGAAIAEIAGCCSVWAWLRLDRSPLWLIPGLASLFLFALLLTRIDSGFAGRAYAAYGGVYIAGSQVRVTSAKLRQSRFQVYQWLTAQRRLDGSPLPPPSSLSKHLKSF